MKKFVKVLVVLLVISLGGLAGLKETKDTLKVLNAKHTPRIAQPSPPTNLTETVNSLKETEHKAMHYIVTVGEDKAGCTAYAISKTVLLTAEHCIQPNEQLYIDQDKEHLAVPSGVTAVFFDHHEHALLVLPEENFTDFIKYDPKTYTQPVQGELIYFWGNPKGIKNILREGYVAGQQTMDQDDAKESGINVDSPVFLFACPTVGGDSGSAIFDAKTGALISVVTFGIDEGEFAGGYALAFTSKQVHDAEEAR